MSNKLSGVANRRYAVLSRIFVIIFGCVSVIWGLMTLPIISRQASIERTANRIIAGERYKTETLLGQMPIVEAAEKMQRCYPRAYQSAAIIRARIVEQGSAGEAGKSINTKELDESIRGSLSCSPSDPFLWLALYWVGVTYNGFDPGDLKYLRMSYQLGPNEGWIAVKRNFLAFANFERLPTDLADEVVNEFLRLLKSYQFFDEAADILVGPGWHVRDQVLPRLIELPERVRKIFAQVLQSKGHDVTIPGITFPKSH